MELKFYKNKSDDRYVSKDIELVFTLSDIKLKDECSIMDPIYVVPYSSDLFHVNYLKDETHNRYYYINDVVLSTKGVAYVHCREDVLMTYKSAIRATTQRIYRQESKSVIDELLVDTQYPIKAERRVNIVEFSGSPFSPQDETKCVALTVSGGV